MVEQSEFAAALALWRGEVLADLGDIGFVVAERTRLDELRLAAWQGRIEVDLAEGRLAEAIARLAELCAVHPDREPLIRLHMLALYQSGRQADSLEVYRNHRHRLAEELGVEPSKELQDLHVAILRREPTRPGLRRHRRSTAADRGASCRRRPVPSSVAKGKLDRIEKTLADDRLVDARAAPEASGRPGWPSRPRHGRSTVFGGGAWLVDLAEITTPGAGALRGGARAGD